MIGTNPRIVIDGVIDNHQALTCQICGRPFTARRRDARHCSPACTQRAYRLRHPKTFSVPPSRSLPKESRIYQCPECDARYLGQQHCPECGVFCHLAGPGGECPHCGELVTAADLGLTATTDQRHDLSSGYR